MTAAELALPAGTPVRYFGDYEILGELARGAMGIVYRARQISLNRTVALKMIQAGRFASPEMVQRFHIEAEAAAQLDHPNIVPVHEVGKHEGYHFLSMRLLGGGTLRERVDALARQPRDAVRLLEKVARAVHYAHQRGVLHRDLKPANILLDAEGEPFVADFGLARLHEAGSGMTHTGTVLGTPSYMSPEQASGHARAISAASDVYGLGAILYHVLCGQPPFAAGTPMATLRKVMDEEPAPPRRANSALDRDIETIVLKCLEKDPARRYGSADALADDLANWLAHRPVSARPVGPVEHVVKWCRRRPAVAALAAAIVVSLVAGTVVSTHFGMEAGRRAEGEAEQRQRAEQREREAVAAHRRAEEHLAGGLTAAGDGLMAAHRCSEARARFDQAWDIARRLGLPELPMTSGLLASYAESPPPLLGPDGASGGVPAFAGHADIVLAMDVAPDGSQAVSASQDGTMILWDVRTGRAVRKWEAGQVTTVAFLPDGKTVLSGDREGVVSVWETESGKCLKTLSGHHGGIVCVAAAPTGALAASASLYRDATQFVGEVKIWDLDAGAERRALPVARGDRVFCLALSPDGKTLVSGGWVWAAKLWDVEKGTVIRTFPGHQNPVQCAVLSRDGRSLLTGSWDTSVKLWDVASGRNVRSFAGHSGMVNSVAFSPDGRCALSGGKDRSLKLWDLSTGGLRASFTGHEGALQSVRFVGGPQVALSAATEKPLRLWLLDRDREIVTGVCHATPIEDAALSADGLLAVSGGRCAHLLDVATGMSLRRLTGHKESVFEVDLSRDGRTAVSSSGDHAVKVWDLATGAEVLGFQAEGPDFVRCCLMPDGQSLLTGSESGEFLLQLRDLPSGAVGKVFRGHTGAIADLLVTRDGRTLYSESEDGTLRAWDADGTNETLCIRSPVAPCFSCMALSADEALMGIGDCDGNLFFWRRADPPGVLERIQAHGDLIEGLAFSPDGRHAFSGARDGKVVIWDVAARKPVRTLNAHANRVRAVALSADGRRLMTAGYDAAIRFWDLQRPAEYRRLTAALPAAQAALAERPDDAAALLAFGEWYAFRGVDAWAADFLERARKSGAEVSHLTLARACLRLGRWADARREFEAAIDRKEAPEPYLELCLNTCASRETNAVTTVAAVPAEWGDTDFRPVDLQPRANRRLTEPLGSGLAGNDMTGIAQGRTVLDGVPFQVGPSLVHLGSLRLPGLPERADGLRVDRKAARLHFLHATVFGAGKNDASLYVPDGTVVGEYVIHYEDGGTAKIPIVYGRDLRDWWFYLQDREDVGGRIAWNGVNEATRSRDAGIRLYVTTWENPAPDRTVASIDFCARKSEAIAAPFCVAITADFRPVTSPARPTPAGGAKAVFFTKEFWTSATPGKVREAIANGADVHAVCPDCKNPRHTVLLSALACGASAETIAELKRAGLDLNACDPDGFTALMRVAQTQGAPPAAVKALAEAGADLNFRGEARTTALHLAFYEGDPEVAAALVEAGADPDARAQGGATVLIGLARGLHDEAVDWAVPVLLRAGARIDARDNLGCTALIRAVLRGKPEKMIRMLLEAGADATLCTYDEHKTALDCARGKPELAGTEALRMLEEVTARQSAQPKPAPPATAEPVPVVGTWRQLDPPFIPQANVFGMWNREEIAFADDGTFQLREYDPPYGKYPGSYTVTNGTVSLEFKGSVVAPRSGLFDTEALRLRITEIGQTCVYVRVNQPAPAVRPPGRAASGGTDNQSKGTRP